MNFEQALNELIAAPCGFFVPPSGEGFRRAGVNPATGIISNFTKIANTTDDVSLRAQIKQEASKKKEKKKSPAEFLNDI